MQLDHPLPMNRLPRPVTSYEDTFSAFREARLYQNSVKPRRTGSSNTRAVERAKSSSNKKLKRSRKKIEIRVKVGDSAAESESGDSVVSTPQGRRKKLKKINFRKLERRERPTADSGSEVSAEEIIERQKKRYDFRRAQIKEIRSKEIRKLLPDYDSKSTESSERSIEEFYEELLSGKNSGPSTRWALERTKLENPQVLMMYQKKIGKYFSNKREELNNMLNQLIVGTKDEKLLTETKKYSKAYKKILKSKGFSSWIGRCRCNGNNIFTGSRVIPTDLNFGKETCKNTFFKDKNCSRGDTLIKNRPKLNINFPFDQKKVTGNWSKKSKKKFAKEAVKGNFFDTSKYSTSNSLWNGDETIIKSINQESKNTNFKNEVFQNTVKKTTNLFKKESFLNGFKKELYPETQKRKNLFENTRKTTWDSQKKKIMNQKSRICDYCISITSKSTRSFVFRRFKKNRKRYKAVIKFMEEVIKHIQQIAKTMNSLYWSFLKMNQSVTLKEKEWFKFKTLIFQNLTQTVFEDPKTFAFLDHLMDFFERNKFYAVRLRRLASRVELIQNSLSGVNRPGIESEESVLDPVLRQAVKDLKLRKLDYDRLIKEEAATDQHNQEVWKERLKLWASVPSIMLLNPENEYLSSQDSNFYEMGDRKWFNPMPVKTVRLSKLCPRVYKCFQNRHKFGFNLNNLPSKEAADRIVAEFLESFSNISTKPYTDELHSDFEKKKLKVSQLSCFTCNIKFNDFSDLNENLELESEQALWKAHWSHTKDQQNFQLKDRKRIISENVDKRVTAYMPDSVFYAKFNDLDEYERRLRVNPDSDSEFYGTFEDEKINFSCPQDCPDDKIIQTIVDPDQLKALQIQKKVREIQLQEAKRHFPGTYSVNPEICNFPVHIQHTPEIDERTQQSIIKKVDFGFLNRDYIKAVKINLKEW